MAKKINVPGRLHSVAIGNILSGAVEIYDDVTKKNQQVINKEVADAIKVAQYNIDDLQAESALVQQLANALQNAGEADLATVILETAQLNTQIANINRSITAINTQLGSKSLVVLSENEYETLVTNEDVDENTLYFVTENEGV